MDLGVVLSILMFVVFLALILVGYNVAFSFASTALLFSFIGDLTGTFDPSALNVLPGRWFGNVSDPTLLAVPFFVLMGAILERSGLAERLLDAIGMLLGPLKGGVAAAVVLVGTLLAAATGVVAATVIVMGLLSLPTMIRLGYDHKLATGVIIASGTLAQLLPPSLVLILLASQMGVGILGLFAGALIPGLLLSAMYVAYALGISHLRPGVGPAMPEEDRLLTGKVLALEVLFSVVPIILLILAVLVSIFQGIATPSESGAVGVFGALLLAVFSYQFDKILVWAGATHITPRWRLTPKALIDAARSTANISILVMTLLFASSFFSLMFLQLGGSDATADFLSSIGGGKTGFVLVAMIAVFLLGINLEFLEITFIVVPIFLPAMDALGFSNQEKIWFTVMMAVNLNMAFISPPVGFSLFYLQSVAPPEVKTGDIHKGALPFMVLQGLALLVLGFFPGIVEASFNLFVPAR
ncbi:MAG: TRAP transporter large permease subunit [Actinomycetota bacterium]|nr:TRAP transporter large permease subunit [Actinomycetota bacterium]